MVFSIVYKKLIFKEIKKAFRITCIMLIVDKLTPHLNKAIKPLKKEIKAMVTMKKPLF